MKQSIYYLKDKIDNPYFLNANRRYVYILFIKNDSSWNNVPFQISSWQDKTYREIYDGISLKRYGTKFG